MNTEIIVALISAFALITAAIITYRAKVKLSGLEQKLKELEKDNKKKTDVINDREFKMKTQENLLNYQTFNEIHASVDRIFSQTKADQFLIYIGLNGSTEFRLVSVIFEQHKDTRYKVNAMIRYRDVEIDDKYRKLLKDVEMYGTLDLTTSEMSSQLLKDFYTIEGIKHTKIRFLHRKSITESDDIVLFGSVATHQNEHWTHLENAIIKTEIEGSILHTIKEQLV